MLRSTESFGGHSLGHLGHLQDVSIRHPRCMSVVDAPFRPSSSPVSPDLDRVRCSDLCSFAQESVVETMGCSDQKVENLHKDFDFLHNDATLP